MRDWATIEAWPSPHPLEGSALDPGKTLMDIALSQIVEAARRRRAAVTAEVAGYMMLLVARSVASSPQRVIAEGIVLSAEGEVGVVGGARASAEDCERELRGLLASLLGLSQSAPPALKAASERVSAGNLQALVAELLAALIPLNHAAAGRALARLYRETSRAELSAPETPSGPPESLSSDAPKSPPSPAAAAGSAISPPVLAAPDSRAPLPSPESATTLLSEAADLDIEVEFVGDDAEEKSGAQDVDLLLDEKFEATPSSAIPPQSMVRLAHFTPEEDMPPVSQVIEYSETAARSDVRELIDGFLAHTRSDERMAADLRKMIGLDAGQDGASSNLTALGR